MRPAEDAPTATVIPVDVVPERRAVADELGARWVDDITPVTERADVLVSAASAGC